MSSRSCMTYHDHAILMQDLDDMAILVHHKNEENRQLEMQVRGLRQLSSTAIEWLQAKQDLPEQAILELREKLQETAHALPEEASMPVVGVPAL